MKKRSTLFFAISLVILVISLTMGCSNDETRQDEKENASALLNAGGVNLLIVIPGDTQILVHLNSKKSLQVPFLNELLGQVENEEPRDSKQLFNEYQAFIYQTGIDPKKHIHSLTMAILGDFMKNPDNPDFVMVVHLDYDQKKFRAILQGEDPNVTQETYQGIDIFKRIGGQKDFAIALLNDNIVAAGREIPVKKSIDAFKNTGPSILSNPRMKELTGKMDFNVVGTFLVVIPDEAKKIQPNHFLRLDMTQAEVFSGNIDYAGNAWKLAIELVTNSPETNSQIVTSFNSLKSIMAGSDPFTEKVMNAFTLTATDESVRIEAMISQEMLDEIIKKVAGLQEHTEATPNLPPTEPPN